MSWSEPGARHPPKGDHTWHRLSVHVKRQDAGSNQMAVIKPLTNTYQNTALEFSDLSTKTLYNVAEEEDETEPVRYNPPTTPPIIAHSQIPTRGLMTDVDEVVELYTPEHVQKNSALSQHVLMERHLQDEVMVVSKFKDDMPVLGDMMSMPEAINTGLPVYPQVHLIQQESDLDPYDEEPISPLEEDGMDSEQFGLLQGYMYNNSQIHEEEGLLQLKLGMGDSVALMPPPSSFRDRTGPPVRPFSNSPMSESILCNTPNLTYAAVILQDYKQSSSTL